MRKSGFFNVLLGVLFLVVGTGKAYCQNYRCNYFTSGLPSLALPASFDEGELTPDEKTTLDIFLSMMGLYTDDFCEENDYFWFPTYLFEADESTLMNFLQEIADTVYKEDGFIVWREWGECYAIHLDSLIYEERWYDEDDNPFFEEAGNKLWYLLRIIFKEVDGYIILDKEMFTYYSELEVDDVEGFDLSFLSDVVCEFTMTYSYPYFELLDEDDDNKTLVKSGDEELYLDCIDDDGGDDGGDEGIKEKQYTDINIYPNPANEQITISLPFGGEGNVDVKVFNMLGVNVLSQQQAKGDNLNIAIHSLPAGVYVVRCSNNDKVITKRFVKQ